MATRSMRGFLTVTLELASGWLIGGEVEAKNNGTLALLDGNALRIPATTMAGSLRGHLVSKLASGPNARGQLGDIDELMGPLPETKTRHTDDPDGLIASKLWVLDVVLTKGGEAKPTVTKRTAINRVRGAAETSTLATGELVQEAATVVVKLRLDRPAEALHALGRLILDWAPSIGRGKSIGQGRAWVTEVKFGSLDLATEAGLTLWLGRDGPAIVDAVAAQVVDRKDCEPTAEKPWLRVDFEFPDGVRIGTGIDEERDAKGVPIILPAGSGALACADGKHVVPGSTWKGVIRSRFEYVLRSLADPLKLDVNRLACGGPPEADAGEPKPASSGSQITCGKCVVCQVFGSSLNAAQLWFSNSEISHAAATERTRVAIDRFTGGARDTALFPELILAGTDDAPARTTLKIRDAGRGKSVIYDPTVRAIMMHVIRDADDALFGIGSRTATGLGTLRVAEGNRKLLADAVPISPEAIQALLELVPAANSGVKSADASDSGAATDNDGQPATSDESRSGQAQAATSGAVADQGTKPDVAGDPRYSGAPPTCVPGQGKLTGHGELAWADVVQRWQGFAAAWTGFNGPELSTLPPCPPPAATHLWAWSPERLLRLRIQDDTAIVAELALYRPQAGEPQAENAGVSTSNVKYQRYDNALTWDPADGRVSTNARYFVKHVVTVYSVGGTQPMEFISMEAAAGHKEPE